MERENSAPRPDTAYTMRGPACAPCPFSYVSPEIWDEFCHTATLLSAAACSDIAEQTPPA